MSEESGGNGKSLTFEVGIWLNSEDKRIRVSLPGGRITTVADDGGERSHRHLYNHLREILKDNGKW